MSRDYTTRAEERGQRIALGTQAKEHALSQKRLERLADVGRAENQPVGIRVLGLTVQATVAELEAEIDRLQEQNENQTRTIKVQAETIQSQSERIGDLVADVGRLESEVQSYASTAAKELAASMHSDCVRGLQEQSVRLQEEAVRLRKRLAELEQYNGEKDERVRELGNCNVGLNRMMDRLEDQNKNQAQTIRVQAETIGRLETEQAETIEMLKDGHSAHVLTLRGDVFITRRQLAHLLGEAYQELFDRLENPDINRFVIPKEQPTAQNEENVPATPNIAVESPVSVHTSPQVRWAGGK